MVLISRNFACAKFAKIKPSRKILNSEWCLYCNTVVNCKFRNFHEGLNFAKLCMCEVSQKLNPREMAKSDSGKSCSSRDFQRRKSIGTASANSAKFRGIRPRMYIEDLL